ncbi:MAG: acylphosphatase [Ruminococcus sp.]|nr:acylphosphatase [Ruminococcus sp.]
MEKIRRHIIFHGEVQGVGFRFRAYHSANLYGVTGWVRNCPDGSVEMEAEGYPKDINAIIENVKNSSFADIYDIESKIIPLKNDSSFHITD